MCYSPFAMGNNTLNTVPPGKVSKVMLPRLAVTIRLVIANPRPLPRGLVVTKGSNILSRTSSGIPRPRIRDGDLKLWAFWNTHIGFDFNS